MDQKYELSIKCFDNLCEQIKEQFPNIVTQMESENENRDKCFHIKSAPGLYNEISLYVDNDDELYFCCGHLCASWYPYYKKNIEIDRYVISFFKGEARIEEYFFCGFWFRSNFQVFENGKWETKLAHLNGPLFLVKPFTKKKILQINKV